MLRLTELLRDDNMVSALGVEPGAIAYATYAARSPTCGEITSVHVITNSGVYKNTFTYGIPNSDAVDMPHRGRWSGAQ